jgi:asparagine synthase (glutamine-hydrolysing)
MCGICGILHFEPQHPVNQTQLLTMRDRMTYRGPDDAGIHLDHNLGLGARRLSIIDLSPAGHMPMSSADGRYWIVYNGEVYNFQELRAGLEAKGAHFISHTDTEVLLQLYMAEGPAMLSRLNGMFALAIWDQQERRLFVARDRTGVKPLYYAIYQNSLYFGSEEKVLFAAGVPARFDPSIWEELLCFRYVAGARTPYQDVRRLLPGHFFILQDGQLQIEQWWHIADAAARYPRQVSPKQAAEEFGELFKQSIALRRISDVPLGTLLSGGLDSGTMTAELARQAGQHVASFTVRFEEPQYDEGPLAQSVAQRWGLDHHELNVAAHEVPALLEESTRLLDEPIVHGNDIYILAISKFAKPLVTVLLSGEGADEVLGGYVRYRLFLYARFFGLMHPVQNVVNKIFPSNLRIRKAQHVLEFPGLAERVMYNSAEVFPQELKLNNAAVFQYRRQLVSEAQQAYADPLRQAMYYDQHTYLQSVLDRNDRMTMGASIECREPFLDFRILEWAASVPNSALFQAGIGKYAMRAAYRNLLPTEILAHKKWGFAAPFGQYFRNVPALRAWVQRLSEMEVFETCPLSRPWIADATQQFLNGNDQLTAIIRQLILIALWYSICINRERDIF